MGKTEGLPDYNVDRPNNNNETTTTTTTTTAKTISWYHYHVLSKQLWFGLMPECRTWIWIKPSLSDIICSHLPLPSDDAIGYIMHVYLRKNYHI